MLELDRIRPVRYTAQVIFYAHKTIFKAVAVAFLLFVWIFISPESAFAATYFVSPSGADSNSGTSSTGAFKTIQKALDIVAAGDNVMLLPGTYMQDALTKRNGTSSLPITIKGPSEAIISGGGNDRIFEINHDYYHLDGFTIDGLFGSSSSESGYRDKLIYVLGKESEEGVTGLKVQNMTLKNAGGECVRLRYFATDAEISGNAIYNCGVFDFKFNDGGKNGEGVYIGTAPEQLKDGKNPTSDTDVSQDNWIHHNSFNTQGNECVDIKEGSTQNIVEYNTCTGQKDSESGGFDSRGNANTFRFNESFGNTGAGVRLGGDSSSDGLDNHVYKNKIYDNNGGGIKFQRIPQGEICGNTMSGNKNGNSVGSFGSRFSPTDPCTADITIVPMSPLDPSITLNPTPGSTITIETGDREVLKILLVQIKSLIEKMLSVLD